MVVKRWSVRSNGGSWEGGGLLLEWVVGWVGGYEAVVVSWVRWWLVRYVGVFCCFSILVFQLRCFGVLV